MFYVSKVVVVVVVFVMVVVVVVLHHNILKVKFGFAQVQSSSIILY